LTCAQLSLEYAVESILQPRDLVETEN